MTFQHEPPKDEKLLRPFSGMTDGQLKRGEGFRRDDPEGLFIGESAKVIERALDASVVPVSFLVDEHWAKHDGPLLERVAREHPEAPIFVVSRDRFSAITGYEVVRGALACFERPRPLTLEQVLADARRIAILEDIENYTNLGAIFRSAAALGMDGIILSPSCHDPLYRRCARVSMGAVFQVPWTRIPKGADWPEATMEALQQEGFMVGAMALVDDSVGLRESGLARAPRSAVLLGTEGEGLSSAAIEACDVTVRIPMAHGVDSLNVGAAAAIAFWELCAG